MTQICKDRVVLVTGAGSGLGRSYALALAEAGALVAVNDLKAEAVADTLSLIDQAGGQAQGFAADVSDYDAVSAMMGDVISSFGDLHAVVNNAGMVRDRMFASMSEDEWDAVIEVHLKGHFCISSHAARYWRHQAKEGQQVAARIINTTSGAGLQGSIGQSNYAAAKGGIATMTLVQAAELGRYGITVNALAPAARTAMTEDVFKEMMAPPTDGSFDVYHPDNVAPLVTWLCSSASSEVTGRVFEVWGGRVSVAAGWRSTDGIDLQRRWQAGEFSDAMAQLLEQAGEPQKVYGA